MTAGIYILYLLLYLLTASSDTKKLPYNYSATFKCHIYKHNKCASLVEIITIFSTYNINCDLLSVILFLSIILSYKYDCIKLRHIYNKRLLLYIRVYLYCVTSSHFINIILSSVAFIITRI